MRAARQKPTIYNERTPDKARRKYKEKELDRAEAYCNQKAMDNSAKKNKKSDFLYTKVEQSSSTPRGNQRRAALLQNKSPAGRPKQ